MDILINSVLAAIALFFLSIPIVNNSVFHTIDIDQVIVEGKEGLSAIEALQNNSKFAEARDSAHALIERFRNDSLSFGPADIADWSPLYKLIKNKSGDLAGRLLLERMQDENVAAFAACTTTAMVSPEMKRQVIGTLNKIKEDASFYPAALSQISFKGQPRLKALGDQLIARGLFQQSGDSLIVKSPLNEKERNAIRRFNVLVLEKCVYPKALHKDPRRNSDWASEYIVQTAMYHIGSAWSNDGYPDQAIKAFDSLVMLYPKTVYAEVIFLENGRALLNQGKNDAGNGQLAAADQQLHRAIGYLEKVERNREIAKQFPKYRYADLDPGVYTNVDVASRAKSKAKRETSLYTLQKAKVDLQKKNEDTQSGYYLEDAVKLIGQCYLQLGLTDSARQQLRILFDFFPESDNLSEAQMIIADSYVRDADMALAKKDSTGAVSAADKKIAEDDYGKAIKEYLRFVNVYSQSDLISKVYIAMGDVYYKLNRPKEAAKSFASALELAKETESMAKVQLEIGNYYLERKQYRDAARSYEIILNNFLSTQVASNAQYLLGDCYAAFGDTAKSLAAYETILAQYKNSSFFGGSAYKLGNYYFAKANYKDALRVYKLGKTYDPNGQLAVKTQFQIGMVW
ncbi:MAG: tetratricopeptide repeat protein, partial [Chitinivibrionales bacterium]|nr:tetratricopeptide repeat protein [Chitinivibrionales bacterium]